MFVLKQWKSAPKLVQEWQSYVWKSILKGCCPVEYSQLQLVDRGEVLTVYFKQSSIIDQLVINKIGEELSEVALEAAGNSKLLLNFQTVKFMASAMLGKLLQLHKRCKNDKIKLKMCGIPPEIMEVFKITQLHKVFDIQKDEPTAIDSFGKRGFFK